MIPFLILSEMTAHTAMYSPRPPFQLRELDPAARKSHYSEWILQFLDHWPPSTVSLKDARPVTIRAIKTPGQQSYMGMVKHSEIYASLKEVEKVTENFEDYPKIWSDVLNVKVNSSDRNRLHTEWTRRAPTFFLPKVHYRLSYTSDKSIPGRIVYRQQLIDGNMVNFSDSLVVLEKLGEERTRVTVLNFFEADLGVLRTVAEGKLWKRIIEDGFKDDIAFRSKVEHPEWDLDRISKETEKISARFPITEVQYTDQLKFE